MSDTSGLNPGQRAAVLHEDGPAAVHAGPGSGKTRVVAARAIRLATLGRSLLVTTFTNDATEEMKARIIPAVGKAVAPRVEVTTLHAFCLRLLKEHGAKFQLLTDENQRQGLAQAAGTPELACSTGGFLSQISYHKNMGLTAESYEPDGSFEDSELRRVWMSYEKAKRDRGLKEFDDLVLDAMRLLETDEGVRTAASARYTHIIVDECQDMNRPQFNIVFLLGREHKNVMLVGDPDQSLYAFRGADPVMFQRFASFKQTRVYELRHNYRSTPNVIGFAESLIRQDAARRALEMIPTRSEGNPVTWQRYDDPDVEALEVGGRILQMVESGGRFRDVAVIYRTNAQSEAFERHFAALGIPYALKDSGDFYARKEIKGLLAYLKFFSRSADSGDAQYGDEWLLTLLNVPNRHLAKNVGGEMKNVAEIRGRRIWDVLPTYIAEDAKTHRGLRLLAQELKTIEAKLTGIQHAGEAIRAVRNATGFDAWLQRDEADSRDNDRIQNVERVQAAASHYATIEEYLAAVDRIRQENERRKAERARRRRERDEVVLGTGHSAKGLEWPYVFAVGWSEEILPHRKAEDIGEERRIAYVIATRARDVLAVSSLDKWNDSVVAPSRFLTGAQVTASEPETVAVIPPHAPDPLLGGLFVES